MRPGLPRNLRTPRTKKKLPEWCLADDPSVTDERGATEGTPYRLETTLQPGKSGTETKQKPFYSLQGT